MYKKILTILFLGVFLSANCLIAAIAEPELFKGRAEKSEQIKEQSELFTGKIDTLDSKDVIRMTVSQVLDCSFSQEGDEFFAEVTNEVSGPTGVIIPMGTVAHGKISESKGAKRLGRDGSLTLDFDYLITPDGREIPIEGKMTTKASSAKAVGKIVATDIGYTAVGGVVGGIVALNFFGLEAAIASQGYTVAGGAAVGGAIGLGASLYRKGKDVLISPGDEIRVKINTSIPLPVYKDTALMQHEMFCEGLDVKINNITYENDPFGEANTITLSLVITNRTKMTFSSFDLALVNDYNSVFHPSIFGDTKLMFTEIKPGDRVAGRVSFSVDNVKRKFWLTFYDRRSRKAIAKISIDNAYRKVSNETKKKNERFFIKKKSNYYKDNDPFEANF
ncbi:MAG TPA: hypothetical protein PLG15_01240 [Candidatus Gastranaerophilaceae bacterium]|nr:hypothetical protein [Candidatus Gastranaerophilaceae bacterium]HPT40992.1 hypothetical protein [Candidatus Gastranaerophilaceae bacterium]